jgi:uncharacterized membrane protein
MKKLGWILLAVLILVGVGVLVYTQTKPAISHSQVVTLTVKPKPDFALAVTPAQIETFVANTVAYSAEVTSLKGFAGQVIFSLDGLPADFTVQFLPGNVVTLAPDAPKGVQINITIPDNDALAGDYTVTVNAESTNYN